MQMYVERTRYLSVQLVEAAFDYVRMCHDLYLNIFCTITYIFIIKYNLELYSICIIYIICVSYLCRRVSDKLITRRFYIYMYRWPLKNPLIIFPNKIIKNFKNMCL